MSHESPCSCLSSVNVKGEHIESPTEAELSGYMMLENLIVLGDKIVSSFLPGHTRISTSAHIKKKHKWKAIWHVRVAGDGNGNADPDCHCTVRTVKEFLI